MVPKSTTTKQKANIILADTENLQTMNLNYQVLYVSNTVEF